MPINRVLIGELQEGSICAQAVSDRNGRVLLESGSPVAAAHIKTLKAWGVTDILIESEIEAAPSGDVCAGFDLARLKLNRPDLAPFPSLIEWCMEQADVTRGRS